MIRVRFYVGMTPGIEKPNLLPPAFQDHQLKLRASEELFIERGLGVTVYDARGVYAAEQAGQAGRPIVREDCLIFEVLHDGMLTTSYNDKIAGSLKEIWSQDSVLVTWEPVAGRFV